MSQKIRYNYNWHRIASIDYPTSQDVVYTYGSPGAPFNLAGRLEKVNDSTGQHEWRYGQLGETTWSRRTIQPVGGMTTPLETTMEFTYDSGGRLQNMTYPDGEIVTYSYNRGGLLRRVQGVIDGSPRFYVNSIRYDHFGDRTYVGYGNGTETTIERHANTRRVWRVNTDSPFGAIQRLEYGYTPTGLISSIANNAPVVPWLNGPSAQTFTYDASEQLTSAAGSFDYGSGTGTRAYALSMRYDRIGNVKRMTQNDVFSPNSGSPYSIGDTTRDAHYQYTGTPHAATAVGDRYHWYDANGNQTFSSDLLFWSRSMNWNEEDRLTSVVESGYSTEFYYDAGGQRSAKVGWSTVLYPNAYMTVRNGIDITKHVFAGGERVSATVRDAGASSSSERQYWMHAESGGATHYVTDSTGSITEHTENLPFGEPWIQQSWSWDSVSRAFHGSERDVETGLHHMGARYYDAREARWTSGDPALAEFTESGAVYDPRNLAAYSYAINSPVSYWDPTGRQQARRSQNTPPPPPPRSPWVIVPGRSELQNIPNDGRFHRISRPGAQTEVSARRDAPTASPTSLSLRRPGAVVHAEIDPPPSSPNQNPNSRHVATNFGMRIVPNSPPRNGRNVDVEQYIAEDGYIELENGDQFAVPYRFINPDANHNAFVSNGDPSFPIWNGDWQGNRPGVRSYYDPSDSSHENFGHYDPTTGVLIVGDQPNTDSDSAERIAELARVHGLNTLGSRVVFTYRLSAYARVNGEIQARADWTKTQVWKISYSVAHGWTAALDPSSTQVTLERLVPTNRLLPQHDGALPANEWVNSEPGRGFARELRRIGFPLERRRH